MALEDIVNFLLKPAEALASIVYDVCFTTEVESTTQDDGTKTYKKTYSGSKLQEACEIIRNDYRKAKDTLMKYTLRPVDTVLTGVYNLLENILKTTYTTIDKKVISPVSEYLHTHPWTWRAGASLALAGLALTSAYFIYTPMYLVLA